MKLFHVAGESLTATKGFFSQIMVTNWQLTATCSLNQAECPNTTTLSPFLSTMGRSIVGYKLDQIKKEKRKRNFIAFDLQLDRLRLLVDSAAISTVPHGGTYTLALSCAGSFFFFSLICWIAAAGGGDGQRGSDGRGGGCRRRRRRGARVQQRDHVHRGDELPHGGLRRAHFRLRHQHHRSVSHSLSSAAYMPWISGTIIYRTQSILASDDHTNRTQIIYAMNFWHDLDRVSLAPRLFHNRKNRVWLKICELFSYA